MVVRIVMLGLAVYRVTPSAADNRAKLYENNNRRKRNNRYLRDAGMKVT
jgi:hypothetical protein